MSQGEKEYKPLQVLIAEDDPDDQFIFETAFREINPDTVLHFFYTSQSLIHYLVQAGIQKTEAIPDLIIGDMKLPFFELKDIAEIRTYKQFEKIPVHVFAEGYADVTRTNALDLGANGFYHKPNSLHTLKDILLEIVADKQLLETVSSGEISDFRDTNLERTTQEQEQQEEEE